MRFHRKHRFESGHIQCFQIGCSRFCSLAGYALEYRAVSAITWRQSEGSDLSALRGTHRLRAFMAIMLVMAVVTFVRRIVSHRAHATEYAVSMSEACHAQVHLNLDDHHHGLVVRTGDFRPDLLLPPALVADGKRHQLLQLHSVGGIDVEQHRRDGR